MNRQILSLMTAVLIVMATFVSCKKDPKSSDTPLVGGKLIPSEIIYGDGDDAEVMKISYDNNNRVTKVGWYYQDELGFENIYTYDGSGRLIRVTYGDEYGEDDYFATLTYSGNFIIITFDDEEDYVMKYELQGDKVVKIYEVEDGETTLAETFVYDTKGNVIKILSEYNYYYDDENYEHYLYETSVSYADRNGIYSGINMPNWILMSDIITEGLLGPQAVNNPYLINQRVEYTVYWEGEEETGLYTYTTTYDYTVYNGDFPEKFTMKGEDNEEPVKKSKMLQGFNKKQKHAKRSSADYVDYLEIKYIEAR